MLAELPNNLEINLRFLDRSDNERVRKWLLDPYVLDLTFVIPGPERRASLPFDDRTMQQYIEALLSDKTRKTFAIEAGGVHVGNVGLKEINMESMKAELFIEIGEGEYRGLGIGKAAMTILMDHVFFNMGFQELALEVLEFNGNALNLYKRLGFQTTHRSGWHYDQKGVYWQVWWMRLPRERWFITREQLMFPANMTIRSL